MGGIYDGMTASSIVPPFPSLRANFFKEVLMSSQISNSLSSSKVGSKAPSLEGEATPAVLLYGSPGVGKTTLTYRLFHDNKLKVVEFNASHTRSGTSFRKTILPLLCEGGVLEQMNTGKKGGIGVLLE
jgi:Holliday junction resolvasome RuvABC ATP-dependent DNA helicase subunit